MQMNNRKYINRIVLAFVIGILVIAMVPPAIAPPVPVTLTGRITYACNDTLVPNGWYIWGQNVNTSNSAVTTTNDVLTPDNYMFNIPSPNDEGNVYELRSNDSARVWTGRGVSTPLTAGEVGSGEKRFDITVSHHEFDMDGTGSYPSIRGTHYGNFTPKQEIGVHRIYTYPCFKTDGHSEFIAFYEGGNEIANVAWIGDYLGNYHILEFASPFILHANVTYEYKIITGCYPQIYHGHTHSNGNGTITCTNFTDANGKVYYGWIPVIRIE